MYEDLIAGFAEIEPLSRSDFLKVRETLTRIGETGQNMTLFQTCFVLHKRQRYFIVHYREMLALDGRDVDVSDSDKRHRDSVVLLLSQWTGLNVRPLRTPENTKIEGVKVIHHDEKEDWKLIPRYIIGRGGLNNG